MMPSSQSTSLRREPPLSTAIGGIEEPSSSFPGEPVVAEASSDGQHGATVNYSRQFAELLAEMRAPRRPNAILRRGGHQMSDDSGHLTTILSGTLTCLLAAGAGLVIWQSITVDLETYPDHPATEHRQAQAATPSSLILAPIDPLEHLLEAAVNLSPAGLNDLKIVLAALPEGRYETEPPYATPASHFVAFKVTENVALNVALVAEHAELPTDGTSPQQVPTLPDRPLPSAAEEPSRDTADPRKSESERRIEFSYWATPGAQLGTIKTASNSPASQVGFSGDSPSVSDLENDVEAKSGQPSSENAGSRSSTGKSEGSSKSQGPKEDKSAKADKTSSDGKGRSGKNSGGKENGGKGNGRGGGKGGKGIR